MSRVVHSRADPRGGDRRLLFCQLPLPELLVPGDGRGRGQLLAGHALELTDVVNFMDGVLIITLTLDKGNNP